MNSISIAVRFTSFLTLLTLDDVIGLDDCHLDDEITDVWRIQSPTSTSELKYDQPVEWKELSHQPSEKIWDSHLWLFSLQLQWVSEEVC